MLIGLLLAQGINLLWGNKAALDIALAHHGGSLRSFLNSARIEGRPVMLSLQSRKVYVGSIFSAPSLHREAHVVIFPTLSGYRRSDDLEIHWRTNYAPVYLHLLEQRRRGDRLQTGPEHFQLVIPLSTIVSATYFDKKIYDQHFAAREDLG